MIQIIVCENDNQKAENIRLQLCRFSGPLSQTVNVYWLKGSKMLKYAEQYSREAHLAIVSMDLANGTEIARSVHQENSLCRLLIHSGELRELPNWVPSGPVSFCKVDQLCAELTRLAEEISMDQNIFSFSSRKEKHFLPYQDITYFQSDLRYVDVVAFEKNQGRFQGKLDEVQDHTPPKMFLRIHQSFLVNVHCITGIDFASHEILISNGDRLPISTKYYKQVCAVLSER